MSETRVGLGEITPTSEPQPRQAQHSPWVKHMKVIKFTGNMKQNISELLTGIECSCGLKKDYSQIINAYGDKITRLREDRAKYKENFTQEKLRNELLQEQLKKISKDFRALEESHYGLLKEAVNKEEYELLMKDYRGLEEKLGEVQEEVKKVKGESMRLQEELARAHSSLYQLREQRENREQRETEYLGDITQDSNLLDSFVDRDVEILRSENELLKLRLEGYRKMQQQLNMDSEEMLGILREYVSEIPSFSSKEERDLFLLAKKMNSNLWNRKLELEIKDLQQRREQVRRLEQEVRRRG